MKQWLFCALTWQRISGLRWRNAMRRYVVLAVVLLQLLLYLEHAAHSSMCRKSSLHRSWTQITITVRRTHFVRAQWIESSYPLLSRGFQCNFSSLSSQPQQRILVVLCALRTSALATHTRSLPCLWAILSCVWFLDEEKVLSLHQENGRIFVPCWNCFFLPILPSFIPLKTKGTNCLMIKYPFKFAEKWQTHISHWQGCKLHVHIPPPLGLIHHHHHHANDGWCWHKLGQMSLPEIQIHFQFALIIGCIKH
jgi:hypothetical protein